jgi:hypothetical protein
MGGQKEAMICNPSDTPDPSDPFEEAFSAS